MGSFVSGLLSGGVSQAGKNKDKDKKKKKKKAAPTTDSNIDYSGLSFKRGGKVKRTGFAKVHRGERVLTKKQQKRYGRKGR